jgi:hypothetical protein
MFRPRTLEPGDLARPVEPVTSDEADDLEAAPAGDASDLGGFLAELRRARG